MAESQNGASTSDSKKKGSSLDEDFGKDFLSSWKSSKMGKDALDFDVETAPLNKKKSFNFDKLDNFELGGDFDKISSFKMDMHDLDFSSPVKKTNKPKDKSCKEFVEGKQESKQENFSFTFDFNELRLDRFNLDSNLLIGEKKSSKFTDGNEHDVSIKNDKVEDSRSNSVMTTNGLEDNETKKLSTSESIVVSKSEHLIEPNVVHGAGPSTSSNYGHDDVPCEAIVSAEKITVIVEENKNDIHSSERHKQHSDRICFTKPHVEKATQDFSIQSVSGDSSAQDARPQFGTGLAFLNPVKANCAKELDDSMKSIDSSLSRNSSPVNSFNSRSWPGASITESPNISGEFQTHHGNNNEVTGGTKVLSESTKGQKDVDNGSRIDSSQKMAHELKYTGEKPNSSQMILPSSLHRGSIIVKSMTVKEKATTAIHLKPLSKSEDNVSQPTPALTSKLLYSVDGGKIKTMHMCPANENRQSKQNDEVKAEKEKDGILKSYDKGLTKGVAIITRSEKNDNSDTSRFQLHPSNLPWQTTSSSIVKGIVPNLVSGSAPIKCFKNISTEGQGSSVKDDKICDISSMNISGITKLNINASNSTLHKETKSIRFSGRNLEFPLNTASKVASSVTTEKYSLLSPPLKRKTIEESKTDPVILNPVKRVMETSERRKSLEVSPKIDWKMETENMEACQDNVSPYNLTSSSGVQEVRSISDFEVPILMENDGNVEKAEACAKELDDICSTLKKKHEEAKELLVRAIVNNNTLLMLNHPLFDEKVRALQKFASSLQSKQF